MYAALMIDAAHALEIQSDLSVRQAALARVATNIQDTKTHDANQRRFCPRINLDIPQHRYWDNREEEVSEDIDGYVKVSCDEQFWKI
jgi:hypothetical protein